MREFTESDFHDGLLNAGGTVAVLFSAEWCGYCRRFERIFEDATSRNGLSCGHLDLSDTSSPFWEALRIHTVPTVIVFRDGVQTFRRDGVPGEGLFRSDMDEVVSSMSSSAPSP